MDLYPAMFGHCFWGEDENFNENHPHNRFIIVISLHVTILVTTNFLCKQET